LNHPLAPSDSSENNLLLAKKTLLARIDMLYRMALTGFIATLANMVVTVVGLWGYDDNSMLMIWAASALIVTGMRFMLVKKYQNSHVDPDQARQWEYYFCCGTLSMGLIWAALAWLFFPQADMLHSFLIILVLAGMMAGSTGALAPSLLAYLSFNLPPATTAAFLMFSMGGKIYSMIGLLVLIFIAIQTRFANVFRHGIDQTTTSYFNNEALHQKVHQTNKRLTDAIESFPGEFALFDIDDRLILCNSKYNEVHGKNVGIEDLIGEKFSDLARRVIEKGDVSEDGTGVRSYYLRGKSNGHGSIRLTRQGDIITLHRN
jgi:hypothetical protein